MLSKLPKADAVLSVFAVISTIMYSWTLVAFSGKVQAWSRFLNLGEILAIYSYSLLTDFIESIIFLSLLLFLCIILPPRCMLDVFTLRGTIIAVCLLSAMIFNLVFYTNAEITLIGTLPGWLVILVCALIIMALLDLLSRKVPSVASALVWFVGQLKFFLYIFLFLSLLALVVVAARNLG